VEANPAGPCRILILACKNLHATPGDRELAAFRPCPAAQPNDAISEVPLNSGQRPTGYMRIGCMGAMFWFR